MTQGMLSTTLSASAGAVTAARPSFQRFLRDIASMDFRVRQLARQGQSDAAGAGADVEELETALEFMQGQLSELLDLDEDVDLDKEERD